MASPGDSSHPEQGRAGPGTDGLPSCGGSGLFLSRWAHPGRVFPSNNALFLHPAISAEECAVCVSSRKPKTSIMVSCPAASSSHSFIEVSPGLYLSTDDMLNLEGTGWGGGGQGPFGGGWGIIPTVQGGVWRGQAGLFALPAPLRAAQQPLCTAPRDLQLCERSLRPAPTSLHRPQPQAPYPAALR